MTEDQIKHMVQRFLGWRLPEPWNPDNGVSYKRPNYAHATADHDWPTGTNLFGATQAAAMVRYMLDGMPDAKPEPADGWRSTVERSRSTYWQARQRGATESEALTRAIDEALSVKQ